jgi:SHS family sialic acid transporter-like MFS transporter
VGLLRFIAALGMGGEWSLGVALVMEVWPNRTRAFMAGLIGAAGNVGYVLVGLVGLVLNHWLGSLHSGLTAMGLPSEWVASLTAYKGWRIIMILCAAPALLTFLIRLFVPESQRWKEEEGRGATRSWATRDLLGVLLGATGPALIIYLWAWNGPAWLPHTLLLRVIGSAVGLAIATVGYTYPAVRYLQRQGDGTGEHGWKRTLTRMLLAACLSGVALLGTWGSVQWAPSWADQLTHGGLHAKEYTQIWMGIGAILGTIAAALMGDWIGRRWAYCILCVLSLASVYLLFLGNHEYGTTFLIAAFAAGALTASFYGWLPLYLPEIFRTRVRATGQGFSFNFGRILAAVGTLQTGVLSAYGYPRACSVMSLIYLVGVGIIWLVPETRGRPLPE